MSRRAALGLVALCGLALLIRVGWILAVDPTVPDVGDASAYHLLADGLAGGDGYVRPFDRVLFGRHRPTAEYPPLHPTVVAVADVAGIDGLTGQRLWLALFGTASVAVTGLAARRLSGSDLALVVAAGIGAVHPLWFQADATLMAETVTALLGACVLLAAVAASERATTGRLVALGIACGLAVLARTDAAVLLAAVAVPAAVVGARHSPTGRRAPVSAALPVLVALAVVAPWLLRDAVRFGQLVPVSTNAGSVLDGANCDRTYGGALIGSWSFSPDCFEGFTQDELAVDDEASVSTAHARTGLTYATEHVGRWPVVAGARLLRTMGLFRPGQQADLGRLEGRLQGADLVGYAIGWVSLALAVPGARSLRRAGRPWSIPVVAVGAVWATTAFSYGNPRFLAVAQPSLAALAACGLVALAGRRAGPSSAR